MFKVKNSSTRTRSETCSKLTIKTTEQQRRSDVFIVNFEYFTPCSGVPFVNFEQVNAGWEGTRSTISMHVVLVSSKAYSEPCQISKMECFTKIVNGI